MIPFKLIERNLPEGSEIYGDCTYLDYEHQDMLARVEKIRLIVELCSSN
jgi:hypothetical protein